MGEERTGLRVKVLQVLDPHGLERQLQLHLALPAVAVGEDKHVVEENALEEGVGREGGREGGREREGGGGDGTF